MNEKPTLERLPLAGEIAPKLPEGEDGLGVYVLRAAYQDKGAPDAISLTGEANLLLKSPVVFPQNADIQENTQYLTTPSTNYFLLGPSGHLGYTDIDLTSVQQIDVFVHVSKGFEAQGGIVEVHLDSPDGRVIGQSESVGQKRIPWGGFGGERNTLSAEALKKKRRNGTQCMTATIEAVEGVHDVYLVFKNAAAGDGEILLSVKEIEFYNQLQPKKEES